MRALIATHPDHGRKLHYNPQARKHGSNEGGQVVKETPNHNVRLSGRPPTGGHRGKPLKR
eukprot:scaffold69942_cov87-Phaeocystis_antarctica.AAC.2